ncbi:MAG: hypothetical protein M1821_006913 [Bathelium mastoideum]|nr:MAG: hypothetical protein M1821_006913 [Bathelium mastoideum]KAI9687629.1 MAG: hypothetical protein M1822_002239 [Bathelium mastoideum]
MVHENPSTIVLITGANQGIGFEAARKLAKENNGWHILIGSRHAERGAKAAAELQREGLSVEPLTIDITNDQSIEQAAQEVDARHGRVDVLINNAGISNEGKRLGWSMREVMMEQFNTNVFGHHLATEAFESLLAKSEHPRVVFTSSGLGSINDRLDESSTFFPVVLPSYRSSKTALNMIMAHWAVKHKKDGWKVNAICPGHVATNLNAYGGTNTVESGTVQLVKMATVGKDGPTGSWSDKDGPVPW